MQKMMVIGSPGSGKSTLAIKLAQKHDLPLIHLDQLWWKSGWVESTREEFDEKLAVVLDTDKWIIDGNFNRTIPQRLEKADTVIFLDYPTRTCLFRVLKRVITNRGKTRADMAQGCPERFNFEFIRYVCSLRRRYRAKILKLLDGAKDKNIIIIKKNSELKRLL